MISAIRLERNAVLKLGGLVDHVKILQGLTLTNFDKRLQVIIQNRQTWKEGRLKLCRCKISMTLARRMYIHFLR